MTKTEFDARQSTTDTMIRFESSTPDRVSAWFSWQEHIFEDAQNPLTTRQRWRYVQAKIPMVTYQVKRQEMSCPHCFILVRAALVAETGECGQCGGLITAESLAAGRDWARGMIDLRPFGVTSIDEDGIERGNISRVKTLLESLLRRGLAARLMDLTDVGATPSGRDGSSSLAPGKYTLLTVFSDSSPGVTAMHELALRKDADLDDLSAEGFDARTSTRLVTFRLEGHTPERVSASFSWQLLPFDSPPSLSSDLRRVLVEAERPIATL